MMIKHSYKDEDVTMLLKDLSNVMKEMTAEEREKAIQSGIHYSEMLPQEKEPSKEYEALYEKALKEKRLEIAQQVADVSEMIIKVSDGNTPVIISLARAGIPVGVLIKRYLIEKHHINALHFAISIIRDKGIDENAMESIYETCYELGISIDKNLVFVDGWTGKGVIKNQVTQAVNALKAKDDKWENLSDELFVLADPANITKYCGTHTDYMLPSACLNSTCAGLISRTILNKYIGPNDYHGAVYFEKFESIDKSREFVDIISKAFWGIDGNPTTYPLIGETGMEVINRICNDYSVKDYKKVKPGIGETTRVLLRRIPHVVLINKKISLNDPDIAHILVLCKEKGISTERYDLGRYKVCGIIKELSDV